VSSLAPPSLRSALQAAPELPRALVAPAATSTPVAATTATASAHVGDRAGTARVFLAALAPMLTVAALRKLVIDQHGGTPAMLHVFVALGMLGAAIGAPLIAARADRSGSHARFAVGLAAADAITTVASAHTSSTALLFALRPLHGIVSMGLLALLFGELRRTSAKFVAHAGGAMIAALAVGPGVGGALSRSGVTVPFDVAAIVSALVAVTLVVKPIGSAASRQSSVDATTTRLAQSVKALHAPLALLFVQRAAIGGFIAAFAVRARASGVSDARIGASFSVFLVAFAAAVAVLGRRDSTRPKSDIIPLGGVVFAAGFLFLAAFSGRAALPFLGLAGIGAGMIYAPCLAIASATSESRGHASTMALVHAAGAVGMVVGPLVAALVDVALSDMSAPGRGALFLVIAGGCQALAALALHTECRALEAPRKES